MTNPRINLKTVSVNLGPGATRNNLNLNYTKSKEIVFRARVARRSSEQLPPPCQFVERVDKLTVLGITINARLTASDHVSGLLSSCSGLLYMLRILRSHGISDASLQDVFRATVLAKLTYCSPAWWSGYCTAADLGRLDGFHRAAWNADAVLRWEFCLSVCPSVCDTRELWKKR